MLMRFLIQSSKKHGIASLLLGSLVLLTACGGGGGGGGGGGPVLADKVKVESPVADSTVADSTGTFRVSFLNTSFNAANLSILLNEKDVTGLFAVESGNTGVTASTYALSGLLKEGTNYFSAREVDSNGKATSKVSGVAFTYDASPHIILTSLTGSGPYVANGVTRQSSLLASASGIIINSSVEGLLSGTTAAHAFSRNTSVLPDAMIAGADVTTLPHFTIVAKDADGDELTTQLIVPKSRLKYGAALQLNNSAFTVIESWVGKVMEDKLGDALDSYVATPAPHADPLDLSLSGYNAEAEPVLLEGDGTATAAACQVLNTATPTTDYQYCKLYVTDIQPVGADPQVVIKTSGADDDGRFIVDASVKFATLKVTIDTAAFDPAGTVYQGALLTTLTFTNVTFGVKARVFKPDIGIVSFELDGAEPFTVNLGSGTPVASDTRCTTPALCSSATPTLATVVRNKARDVLASEITSQLDGTLVAELNEALQGANIPNTRYEYAVSNDLVGADAIDTVLNFALTGSVITEAKTTATGTVAGCDSTSKVCGGFIALGGSTYSEGITDKQALGSYFDPLDAASVVGRHFVNATDDIIIALSENSLNQLLAGIYQSRLLSSQRLTTTMGDLGDIGEQIIAVTASLKTQYGIERRVFAHDLVTVDFKLEAVPSASFSTGTPAGMELRVNALDIFITLYRLCPTTGGDITPDDCTPLYSTKLVLDSKMLMNFGLLNGLPQASVKDAAVHIVGDVTNTFLDPTNATYLGIAVDPQIRIQVDKEINKDTLALLLPMVLGDYIDDFAAELVNPAESTVDLPGLGLDESAWLLLKTLTVDAKQEFIQLSASLLATEPVLPQKAVFRLNITDCEANVTEHCVSE